MKDKFKFENFNCFGFYAGPDDTTRMPPNAEIIDRTLRRYEEDPRYYDPDYEPDFDKILEQVKKEVRAEYADYVNPLEFRKAQRAHDRQMDTGEWAVDSNASSESSEEYLSSEEVPYWSSEIESPKEIITSGEIWESDSSEEYLESESSEIVSSVSSFDEETYMAPVPMKNISDPQQIPANSEALSLYNLNTKLLVPKDQRWEELTESGYKLAVTWKRNDGQQELFGPLAMYFSSGTAAMKEKLKGSQADFNEAVTDILSSMLVDNLIQSQAANVGILTSDEPFSPDYVKLLKTKHQIESQILKVIETRQKLTTVPIRIRHAEQVNVGLQQVVNNDDGQGG